jgi:hypothetical protein
LTTHELAGLLAHLAEGLGLALKDTAKRELVDAAAAFRELPSMSMKEVGKILRKPEVGGVDQAAIGDRVRACREGTGESVDQLMKDINKLKLPELKALLTALGQDPGKGTVAKLKTNIRGLLETSLPPGASPPHVETTDGQIEEGCRLMEDLRTAPLLTIEDVRTRFEAIRRQPRHVVEGIARKLGYEFSGGKDAIADELLQTLERMRISKLHAENITGSL